MNFARSQDVEGQQVDWWGRQTSMGPEQPCTFLLGMPSTQGPDYSLPRPFLRVVITESGFELWNYIKSGICFKSTRWGEELNEGIDETILSKNLWLLSLGHGYMWVQSADFVITIKAVNSQAQCSSSAAQTHCMYYILLDPPHLSHGTRGKDVMLMVLAVSWVITFFFDLGVSCLLPIFIK